MHVCRYTGHTQPETKWINANPNKYQDSIKPKSDVVKTIIFIIKALKAYIHLCI